MQDDITRFIKTIPFPAVLILFAFCVGGMIFGAIGVREAWRAGSRLPALLSVLTVLGMGALAIAIALAYFAK